MSVRTTIKDEKIRMHEFVRKMDTTDHVLSEYFKQQKSNKQEEQEEKPSWKHKPLHIWHVQKWVISRKLFLVLLMRHRANKFLI